MTDTPRRPSRRVDLVVPELHERDATSTHTRFLRDLLVEDGHRVQLVAERGYSGDEFVPLTKWSADADLTILQHSIGSAAADEIITRDVSVVLNYHNVTPFEFVEPWEPAEIPGLRWGRDQLWRLAPLSRLAIAVSNYNARELLEVGFDPVAVGPVMFTALADTHDATGVGSVGSVGTVGGSGPVLLFVGRVAPNKCQQDLVAALAVLRGFEGFGGARLVLVGGVSSGGYSAAVERLAVELGVGDAVTFAGSVSEAELVGWFRRADVFVCVSEHEGFCVPLVEAMGFGLPVVAFGAGAVPETLAGAGVVLGEKSPVGVAEAVARVVSDGVVRERLVARGRVRAAELGSGAAVARMRELLGPLLGEPARTS